MAQYHHQTKQHHLIAYLPSHNITSGMAWGTHINAVFSVLDRRVGRCAKINQVRILVFPRSDVRAYQSIRVIPSPSSKWEACSPCLQQTKIGAGIPWRFRLSSPLLRSFR
eukprot:1512394-Rhodomonas_salina.2